MVGYAVNVFKCFARTAKYNDLIPRSQIEPKMIHIARTRADIDSIKSRPLLGIMAEWSWPSAKAASGLSAVVNQEL